MTRDRAIIVIAHRLSSVMYADEILFLDAGRIVERGAHDVLVARGGRYAALYELQTRMSDGEPVAEAAGRAEEEAAGEGETAANPAPAGPAEAAGEGEAAGGVEPPGRAAEAAQAAQADGERGR